MKLPVQVGQVLAGKYRVDAVLGQGAMGAVVAATHLDLGERRAIKLMLPTALAAAEAVARFMREARAASRLKSEHVAHVHDVGTLPDGAPFMVMEHLEGSDLRALSRQRGRVGVPEAVIYALQVCEALAEAHALGIVHRDLKPANLFLTHRHDQSACVKVLDFGISKVDGAVDGEVTQTDVVLGSPAYMSPEQMRSSRDVDGRTDIWSLGVILYQLVTGQLPFRGANITEIISRVLQSAPPAPSTLAPGVPPAFDAVVLRCLARDRAERYANVAELAGDLAPLAGAAGRASAERVLRVLASVSATSGRPAMRLSLPSDPIAPGPISASGAAWSQTSRAAARRSQWTAAAAVVGLLGGALAGVLALRGSAWVRAAAPGTETVEAALVAPRADPPKVLADAPSPEVAPVACASASTAPPLAVAVKAPVAAPRVTKPVPPPAKPSSALGAPVPPAHSAPAPHRLFGFD